MMSSVRKVVDRSVFLSSLNYWKGQVMYRVGLAGHLSGATHARLDLDASVRYVEDVVADYLQYAEVTPDFLVGKDVLEIGPGDNLGVALGLIARGARSVTCLDRFDPQLDDRRNAAIYRRQLERLDADARTRAEAAILRVDVVVVEFDPTRIRCQYGIPIEAASAHFGASSFDLILSRAVLEHVRDVDLAWTSMVHLLVPGGQMWHKVDFRNHGKFGQFHPLHFLTVSDRIWDMITAPDPTLNRERTPTYLRLARGSFDSVRCYQTHVLENVEMRPHPDALEFGRDYGHAERELVAAIRPRLIDRFRDLSDEDLLSSGIFLICRGQLGGRVT